MTRGRKYLSTSYGEGKELEEQRKSAELFTQAADELAPAPAGPPRVDAQPLNRPTERPYYRRHVTVYEDTNDCSDGKIAGGLLGGGLGAAISRGDGRWWAIPLGAVVGSHIGCDLAGG